MIGLNIKTGVIAFAEALQKIPDEFFTKEQLTNADIEEYYKTISSDFYVKIRDAGLSLNDIDVSISVIDNAVTMILKRTANYVANQKQIVNYDVFGFVSPEKEMSVLEWNKRAYEISNKWKENTENENEKDKVLKEELLKKSFAEQEQEQTGQAQQEEETK